MKNNQKCENCIHNGICTRQRLWSNGFESDKEKIENCDAFLIDFTCKPQTNYDKITSSVETLAEIMDNYRWCPYYLNSTCDSEIECIECIKEWLQKECDES